MPHARHLVRRRRGAERVRTHEEAVRRRAHRHRARRDLHGQGHRFRVPVRRFGTRRELDDRWPRGSHGGTYGGNPIGCAAALATIDVLTAPEFLDNVNARGTQLLDGLRSVQADDAGLRQVRGVGLMVATVFDDPARVVAIMQHCLHEGRLILMSAGTDETVLRWMPPLVVTAAEIDEALQAFAAAVKATA